LRLAGWILRTRSPTPRDFAEHFAAEHRRAVLTGEHDNDGGFPRTVIRFFELRGLVAREDWREMDARGKLNAILNRVPSELRAGLELLRRQFEDERRYRNATGEPARSSGSERSIFLILSGYASWLQANGLTSWQQLTPERFRAALASRGKSLPISRIATDVRTVRSFLAFLVAERRLFRNPLLKVRPPKVPRLLRETAGPDQIDDALKRITSRNGNIAARAIAALIVLHGLTYGDLRLLRLGDYKRRTRTLWLNRRRLGLTLDPLTHEVLVAYLAQRRASPKQHALFVTVRTQKSGSRATSTYFASQLQALGIRAKGFAFRKALVIDALRGEDSIVAARLFGMSKSQIDRYLCLVASEKLLAFQPNAAPVQDRL
jgi:site-specific recombinase XerC